MKIGPVIDALKQHPGVESLLVHTGQHYDENMSKVFFDELGIPRPDVDLGVGSGSHGEQTARVLESFERVVVAEAPDVVVVVGDVNSTLACALAAAKLKVPVAHVEAGLRSFDRSMPEEINRIVTDTLSEFLFVTEPSGVANLENEGVPEDKIFHVGNVMIDTLARNLERIAERGIGPGVDAGPQGYAALTLHRPSNVDDREALARIAGALGEIAGRLPVFFPVHPRTRGRIKEFGPGDIFRPFEAAARAGVRTMEPLGALEFLALMRGARFVLTDSGGIQEETTFLGIPCITLRENTERPVTVEIGTNVIVGTDAVKIREAANEIIEGRFKKGGVPELWDGRAAERIARVLVDAFKD